MSEEGDPTDIEQLRARAVALETRMSEMLSTHAERLIHAELKAEAVRAGMVDLDGLKLIDTGGMALNEAGELEGGASVMARLRQAKPWLFTSGSSSSAAAPPPARPAERKPATAMNHDEWRAARADMLRRLG